MHELRPADMIPPDCADCRVLEMSRRVRRREFLAGLAAAAMSRSPKTIEQRETILAELRMQFAAQRFEHAAIVRSKPCTNVRARTRHGGKH